MTCVTLIADDHPSTSRVVRKLVLGINDTWNDEDRQRLKPYTTQILCTTTNDADEETRAWLVTDWLVRVHAPAFLRLARLEDRARALELLPCITDVTLAGKAQPTIDAAYSAAYSAAGLIPRDDAAKRDYMVYRVVVLAAYVATRSEIDLMAYSTAYLAAYSLPDLTTDSAVDPGVASVFQSVVHQLQDSALDLLDRMIAVGQPEPQP